MCRHFCKEHCGSAFIFADPDPAVHLNADLDPAAFFKIKIKISTNFLDFFQFFYLNFSLLDPADPDPQPWYILSIKISRDYPFKAKNETEHRTTQPLN